LIRLLVKFAEVNLANRLLLLVTLVAVASCSRQASITIIREQEDSVANRRMVSLERAAGHNDRCDWKYDLPEGMKMELAVEAIGNGHWYTEQVFAFPAETTGASSGLISLEYKMKFREGSHLASAQLQTEIQLPHQRWNNSFDPWLEFSTCPGWEFAPSMIDPKKLGDSQPLWTFSVMVNGKYQPMERATIRLTRK
jgi:hypothetical protein